MDVRVRRILFVAEAVTLAQVVRLGTLARAVPPTEFEVHFASASTAWARLEGGNPVRHPLRSITPVQMERSLRLGTRLYSRPMLSAYLEDDLRLLDRVEPDLVVGDLRWTLPTAAALRGVPSATLINAYWSPYAVRGAIPVPPHPLVRVFGEKRVARALPRVMPWILRQFARPLDAVRAARGLPPLGDLLRLLTDGTWVLHPDAPELVPTTGLPPHHLFLGPVLWQPDVPLPPGWPAPGGPPVVYVTLGSSGPSHLLSSIIAELARLPIRLLVATAGRARIGPVPANVLVADYLPGNAAVERASVVVTNGGSSTGYQALACGRPVVGVPWNLDQLLASQAVESAGAGSSVRASRPGIRQLASRVEAALEGAHSSGASRVREALGRLDARSRFREWIRHALAPRPATRS